MQKLLRFLLDMPAWLTGLLGSIGTGILWLFRWWVNRPKEKQDTVLSQTQIITEQWQKLNEQLIKQVESLKKEVERLSEDLEKANQRIDELENENLALNHVLAQHRKFTR